MGWIDASTLTCVSRVSDAEAALAVAQEPLDAWDAALRTLSDDYVRAVAVRAAVLTHCFDTTTRLATHAAYWAQLSAGAFVLSGAALCVISNS